MNRLFLRRGFTLIEVLVVISIIGILSSILYANFNSARVDAKNKAFKSSLKEVQLALEVYKSQNGKYPDNSNLHNLGIQLVPQFIAALPSSANSANGSACTISYTADTTVGSIGSWYKLKAVNCHGGATSVTSGGNTVIEGGVTVGDEFALCPKSCGACGSGSNPPTNDDDYRKTAAFYNSYAVYSFGGECK